MKNDPQEFQTPARILVAEADRWQTKQELLKTIVATAQPIANNQYVVDGDLLHRLKEFL
ncbi:hypothetical protein H6F90_29835 [Trichocoleus sp. FACHB-591]|uniref:hypothetical protein n=1 Tax=Trichocoleus sp. FACHB-591 TaxID=2692872 RepID=UPI0016862726|nr:hypothetical protein [Trichocoleus sp. FACHB-591]MBD2099268.1 hypothetical protein [Trichocoleus sp. FACHB-591]